MLEWLTDKPKYNALKALETLGLKDDQDARVVFNIGGANPSSSVIPDQSGINVKALTRKVTTLQSSNLSPVQAEAAQLLLDYLETNHSLAAAVRTLARHGDIQGASIGTEILNAKTDINAAYTGETIQHSDGMDYAVIDTEKLDFTASGAVFGKKTKPTLVRVARQGEEVVTNPGKVEESRITAKGGEYIFINKLPGGKEDAFIPRDEAGIANGEQIVAEKYELVGGDVNSEGAFFRPKGASSQLLHEVITKPSVIKDAWGPGSHQFLDEGATLKSEKGRVTGIDKAAFDETWSITDKAGRIQNERTGKAASL